jgi:hypothetical protein
VFPLFTEAGHGLDYLLSDEAMEAGAVTVAEVSEGGSVPTLTVENRGDSRVLFLEGEELRGAKQNRVLNTSVLVPAHSKTTIPVSCVERGRWHYRTREFGSAGTHSSSKLRSVLKGSCTKSVREGQGHTSDQMAIWGEVGRQANALGARSETGAMSDTYESYRQRLNEFRERLQYIDGATGFAVAIGKKVVAVDLFDKPPTCRKVWDRLLTGLVIDALEEGQTGQRAETNDVQFLLGRVGKADWEQAPTPGEGEEYRSEADANTHASGLWVNGAVVHGSVVVSG